MIGGPTVWLSTAELELVLAKRPVAMGTDPFELGRSDERGMGPIALGERHAKTSATNPAAVLLIEPGSVAKNKDGNIHAQQQECVVEVTAETVARKQVVSQMNKQQVERQKSNGLGDNERPPLHAQETLH